MDFPSEKVITICKHALKLTEDHMLFQSQKLEQWEISWLSIRMKLSLLWTSMLLETFWLCHSMDKFKVKCMSSSLSFKKYSRRSSKNLNSQRLKRLVHRLRQWVSKQEEMPVIGLLTTWVSLLEKLRLESKVITKNSSFQKVLPPQEN